MTKKRHFTLGIEEEFQLVDCQTGELCSCAPRILEKSAPYLGEHIKPEMLQTTIELVSDVFPDIATARKELYSARTHLARLVAQEGIALLGAGTHPTGRWEDQLVTQGEGYEEMEEEYQDMIRADLIFGLHIHIGLEEKEEAIAIMNQVRTWLPHLIALSSNSPFWAGRMTGVKSYRSVLGKRFPRSGTPYIFASWDDFNHYVRKLVEMGAIDSGKKIWWDIRPHPFFQTLEFRVCDMTTTVEETLSLAALCQALVAKLSYLNRVGTPVPVIDHAYIEENKWRAMRYGLDAELIDFTRHRHLSMRDSIEELLELIDDCVDELGCRREINALHELVASPYGTGADRQITLYQQSDDIRAVVRALMERTLQGIV